VAEPVAACRLVQGLAHMPRRGVRPCSRTLDSSTCTLNAAVTTGRRAVAAPCLTSLEVRQEKLQGPLRAGCAIELYRATQLLGQEAYQLQTEGVSVAEVPVHWESDAGVTDD
jgi:hypothetical protein